MNKKMDMNLKVLAGMGISAGMMFSCNAPAKKDGGQHGQDTKKPNIIYIMADDMGYGDLGCYGQEIIKTPGIDKMASEGMSFTQHYCGTSVCAPSRCVLMTGKHTGNAYIRGNKQDDPHGQLPLPNESVTVAELLKGAGYVTGMIGKWGLGETGTTGDPNKQGWDFFYGYTDQVLAHSYYPEYLIRNGKKEYLDNEVFYLDSSEWHKGRGSYATKKVEYSNDLFTDEALNFIKKNKDTNFFLYLPYTIPHNNGEAPNGQKQEVPDYGMYAEKDWHTDTMGYAAMITRLDGDVGKIIALTRELGLDENTLVIFTSDNGPMKESTGFTAFFNSNGKFRGAKRDMYEGGIRIPHIAWWPGKIKANTESDHLSAFWDFLPTACDVAGVETPENIDGISYLPELLGQEQEQHDIMYWELFEREYVQAIRKGAWKLVRHKNYDGEIVKKELYNIEEDPSEENDLIESNPGRYKELDSLINVTRTESEVFEIK